MTFSLIVVWIRLDSKLFSVPLLHQSCEQKHTRVGL